MNPAPSADSVPADLSFEQAIVFSQDLLAQWPQHTSADLEATLCQLLSSSNGARGFFVAFLTADSLLADALPSELLATLRPAPAGVVELLVKNLVMPTAMAITHRRQGNPDQQQSSERVARRTAALLQQLDAEAVRPVAEAMRASAATGAGAYADFLARWGYDAEQRAAMAAAVADLLGAMA